MEEEKDAFYVLRKGDVIGIYKSLSDCQAQVSSSVCDPPVSVYKGYTLPKETEEYLASRGLKNALYSMHAVEVKDNLFGNLVPCPFQEPDGLAFSAGKSPQRTFSHKRSTDMVNELQPNGLVFSVDKSSQKISNRKRSTDMVNELVLEIDRRDGGGEEFDHPSILSANVEWDPDLLSQAIQVMEVIDEAISARNPSNSQEPSSALPPSSPSAQELLYRFSLGSDEISAQTTEAVEGNLSNPEAWLSDNHVYHIQFVIPVACVSVSAVLKSVNAWFLCLVTLSSLNGISQVFSTIRLQFIFLLLERDQLILYLSYMVYRLWVEMQNESYMPFLNMCQFFNFSRLNC